MKVLIVNEFKTLGGAEVYVKALGKILETLRSDVYYIFFNKDEERNNNKINIDHEYYVPSRFFLDSRIFNPLYYYRIRKIINAINPDYIFVNNLTSSPLTQLLSLNGYNVYQVVHDCSMICPNSKGIRDDGKPCLGMEGLTCFFHCRARKKKLFMLYRNVHCIFLEFIRRKIVNKFIVPSKFLTLCLNVRGYNVVNIPNPLEIADSDLLVKSDRFKQERKKFLYLGGNYKDKGIDLLIAAFKNLSKEKIAAELHVYGGGGCDELKSETFEYHNIIIHGKFNRDELGKMFSEAWALIVPSYCMDNYPTTILEAFYYRCLTVGSNRGGISELLSDYRGIIFEYDVTDLCNVILKTLSIDKNKYISYTENGYKYYIENNDINIYRNRIAKLFCN